MVDPNSLQVICSQLPTLYGWPLLGSSILMPSKSPEESWNVVADDLIITVGLLTRRIRAENLHPLNLSQGQVLRRLQEMGELTNAHLSRLEGMTPQSMSNILLGLQKAGLVRRRLDPEDKRQMLYELTPLGKTSRQENWTARRKWLLSAIADFTPEQREVLFRAIDLLRKLAEV
jgi:DNA-binding MarR family transcriptional regulator